MLFRKTMLSIGLLLLPAGQSVRLFMSRVEQSGIIVHFFPAGLATFGLYNSGSGNAVGVVDSDST